MIDKQEFYHGAAIVQLLENPKCQSIKKHEFGYIVNDGIFIFLKYRTKARSPWVFSFNQEEVGVLNSLAASYKNIIIVLICGGDGICAIAWKDGMALLGNNAGWISAKRNFKECYAVAGSNGKLKGKVPLQQWPNIVFDDIIK